MTFADTHLHVADAQFDADRDEVFRRALDAGVTTLVEIAESPVTWEPAIRLAEKHPFIYASLGIHPHHAHEAGPAQWPELAKRLRDFLQHPKAVAVGEFGLDYYRMRNTKEQQEFLYRRQLELARDLGKPVVIHSRDAQADTQKILFEYFPLRAENAGGLPPAGVIHCFSGTWDDARAYLGHGFMLGIDGPVTYPNSLTLQGCIRQAPLDRLVLETDAPYLPPQKRRGQRNEPACIPMIAEAIGQLKHMPVEDVARQTTSNAKAFYRL